MTTDSIIAITVVSLAAVVIFIVIPLAVASLLRWGARFDEEMEDEQ